MGIAKEMDLQVGSRYDVICTLPKSTAATEKMIAYGSIVGRGTSKRFTGNLAGKTFIVTDSSATATTAKTLTFTRSMFVNPEQPTLAEIVTALNALWAVDATPTVASAGSNGELVVTGAATGTTNILTIGAGTANEDLGFPKDGVVTAIDNNGHQVNLTLPAQYDTEFLYSRIPHVKVSAFTVATRAQANPATFTWTWTPSTRVLSVKDGANAASVAAISITF